MISLIMRKVKLSIVTVSSTNTEIHTSKSSGYKEADIPYSFSESTLSLQDKTMLHPADALYQ